MTFSHQIRRLSSISRFDFDNVKNSITYDAVAVFHNTVMKLPRPTVFDLTKFLSAAVKMKQYSVALHLFEQLLHWYAPVNHTNIFSIDFGFALFSGFFKHGCETAMVTLTTPIKGLLSVGRIDDAAKLLKKLIEEKLGEPNEVTFYIDDFWSYVICIDGTRPKTC